MSTSWHTRYAVEKSDTVAPSIAKDSYEAGAYKEDGSHSHLLRLVDGTVLQTQIDGGHMHMHNREGEQPHDGNHTHVVKLQDGTLLETRSDGTHRHPYGHCGSAYEGVHSHILDMPDGSIIETQIDGPHYHYCDPVYAEEASVMKQLPAEVGPEVIDQSGWTTTWIDAPPRLPVTTAVYFDTDETIAKANELVANLKDIQKENAE